MSWHYELKKVNDGPNGCVSVIVLAIIIAICVKCCG